MRRPCARRPAWVRWSPRRRFRPCRSTAAASSRWRRCRPASRCRRARSCPRINGGRPRTNEYLFDGISVLQPEPGQVAFFPVVDAIQEFKIETNSPPAEFGRFNGGVINLTTKAGVERAARHGLRVLPPRVAERPQLLRVDQPGEARVPPQPVRRRARRPAATRSHVLLRGLPGPAAAHRPHGHLHRADGAAAAGHLHRGDRRARAGHLRPGDDGAERQRRVHAHAVCGRRDSRRTDSIRWRWRCCSAIRCRPPPGTANNYRRTAQRSGRPEPVRTSASITGSVDRDQVFARLSNFQGTFLPVTPLPEGSGVDDRHAGPAGHHVLGVRRRTTSARSRRTCSTNCASAIRGAPSARTAAQLSTTRRVGAEHPGHPVVRRSFPNTLPTFTIGGAISSSGRRPTRRPISTPACPKSPTRSPGCKGRHTVKAGFDWRWERLNVIQPPSPTGSFTFNALGSDLPGIANTGTPLASFLLGQVQTFSIDLQTGADPGAGAASRSTSSRTTGSVVEPPHHQPRPALHAELPVHRDQRPDGGVQSRDAAARVPGRRAGAAAQEEQLRPAARAGLPR